MTVGQLILLLQKFNADTPVVINDMKRNALVNDYVDLEFSSVVKIKARPLFKDPHIIGYQLYDGSLRAKTDKSIEIVSISGKPRF